MDRIKKLILYRTVQKGKMVEFEFMYRNRVSIQKYVQKSSLCTEMIKFKLYRYVQKKFKKIRKMCFITSANEMKVGGIVERFQGKEFNM